MGDWTFFSNYGHVLVCLARNGNARLRDVAQDVGITERAVQKIVKDMQAAGFITVRKQGRCNRYRINRRKTLRHGLESHCTVGKLLALVAPGGRIEPPFEAEESAVAAETANEAAEIVVEPLPEYESPADPEPEAVDMPGPAVAAEAEPETDPGPEAELPPRAEPEPKPRPTGAKPDVEQQGSLF